MFSSGWHLVRLLRATDRPVWIRVTHDDPESLLVAAADEAGEESTLDDDDYVAWALEQCRRHRIDVFWPHYRLGAIAGHLDRFAADGVAVVCAAPDGTTYQVLADKVAQMEACRAAAVVEVPEYEAVTTISGFRHAVDRLVASGHVACCKPAQAEGATGFRILSDVPPSLFTPAGVNISVAEAERALAVAGEPFPPLLVCEFLSGHEWSIDCVARGGELVAGVARRKDGRVQRVVHAPDLIEIGRRAAATFNLSYMFNVQVREDRDGVPKLLEINPRMSAATNVSCAGSGVNLPALALDLATSASATPSAPARIPRDGVAISRIEHEIVVSGLLGLSGVSATR
jgi:ATP-grasp in the biosynthetic pathway with Ter operon